LRARVIAHALLKTFEHKTFSSHFIANICERVRKSQRSGRLTSGGAQVELPLGATEDRICGTIDIEKALMEGIKAYEPGLLVAPSLHSTMAAQDSMMAALHGMMAALYGMMAALCADVRA
jgi:hypothetical protein